MDFKLCFFILRKGTKTTPKEMTITAAEILGNPAYPAISYGGYRTNSREDQ